MDDLLDAWFARASVRTVTMSLVEHVMFDEPLTPAEVIDFGVATKNHYRALQTMLRDVCCAWDEFDDAEQLGIKLYAMQCVITELDQALGNGAKLTALIREYVPAYADLVFETTWDALMGQSVAKPEELNSR